MNLQAFLKTHQGSMAENYWGRVVNGALLVLILMLTFALLSKKDAVVIQPPTLAVEAVIEHNKANQGYMESWAMYLATLLGNVTPSNVSLIKGTLGPLLSSGIYQDVVDVLEEQAQEIQQDNIKRRFEPKLIETERSSEKIFVYGYSFTQLLNGSEEREELTFEFKIAITNYKPEVNFIDAYSGRPRNAQVLESMGRREKTKQERKDKDDGL